MFRLLVVAVALCWRAAGAVRGEQWSGSWQPRYGGGGQDSRGYGRADWRQPHDTDRRLDRLERLELLHLEARDDHRGDGKHKKDKKKKKGKKHTRDSSSSTSSSSSSSGRDKKKKRKKDKKRDRSRDRRKDKKGRREDAAEPSAGEMAELQEFRRQAEVLRIRQEVQDAVATQGVQVSGGTRGTPRTPPPKDRQPERLTPKTAKLVVAEARVLSNGECRSLVAPGPATWAEVKQQLYAHPVADIKPLYAQLRPDGPVPRAREQIVEGIMETLLARVAG